MGVNEDGAVVAPLPQIAADQPVTLTVGWSVDLETLAGPPLETPRPGYEYDPEDPGTWMYCHECGEQMRTVVGNHESYGDFDYPACSSCDFRGEP